MAYALRFWQSMGRFPLGAYYGRSLPHCRQTGSWPETGFWDMERGLSERSATIVDSSRNETSKNQADRGPSSNGLLSRNATSKYLFSGSGKGSVKAAMAEARQFATEQLNQIRGCSRAIQPWRGLSSRSMWLRSSCDRRFVAASGITLQREIGT